MSCHTFPKLDAIIEVILNISLHLHLDSQWLADHYHKLQRPDKKEEEERKAYNEKRWQLYWAAVKDEAEQDQGKAEKQWPCWTKPKLTGIEGLIQWPKKVADEEEGDSESHNDDDDEMINGDD